MGIVLPTSRPRLAAMLLHVPLYALFEFGTEVADKALQRPGERFTES